MAENGGRTAASGRTQLPVADGRAANRPAKSDSKRQIKGFILRKNCTFGGDCGIIHLQKQREKAVFAVGKETSSVQADAAVFS